MFRDIQMRCQTRSREYIFEFIDPLMPLRSKSIRMSIYKFLRKEFLGIFNCGGRWRVDDGCSSKLSATGEIFSTEPSRTRPEMMRLLHILIHKLR